MKMPEDAVTMLDYTKQISDLRTLERFYDYVLASEMLKEIDLDMFEDEEFDTDGNN